MHGYVCGKVKLFLKFEREVDFRANSIKRTPDPISDLITEFKYFLLCNIYEVVINFKVSIETAETVHVQVRTNYVRQLNLSWGRGGGGWEGSRLKDKEWFSANLIVFSR